MVAKCHGLDGYVGLDRKNISLNKIQTDFYGLLLGIKKDILWAFYVLT